MGSRVHPKAKGAKVTEFEYLVESIEEYSEVAIKYGSDPSQENELAFCEASEVLYQALELIKNGNDKHGKTGVRQVYVTQGPHNESPR